MKCGTEDPRGKFAADGKDVLANNCVAVCLDLLLNERIELFHDVELSYPRGKFSDKGMAKLLVHDSPYFKILNFNFKAGQELPVHAHDIEGQVSLTVLEGEGEFLGKDGASFPAKQGDVVISEIAEPHGLRAKTDLRLLVTIAPPI